MHELVLEGCRPVPLAHYLKALGILRLVAEQKDRSCRGCWQRDRFVLFTKLSRQELEQFFLEEYAPTPIVGPWNGGSGFYEKDNKVALTALMGSTAARFEEYRNTIQAAQTVLATLGVTEKGSGDDKHRLLEACRGALPDGALPWLDAAFVLSSDGPRFPPLLGTGGNDGRLDFTNNFMQRVISLVDAATGAPEPGAESLLRAALFDEPTSDLLKGAPIGQFLPNHAGGANAQTGFTADSLINPWDYVLTLEGAAVFAASSSRRLESTTAGALSYPFTVRPAAVGYASAANADETSARAEMWLPLWDQPSYASEVGALFSEGRAQVGGRPARDGVDFARAVAELGIDRGVAAFQRYAFQERNGLAFFAVPLGRFPVRAQPKTALLYEVDAWLDKFRGKASGKTAPASVRRVLHLLEAAVFDLCLRGDATRTQAVLVALGRCQQVLSSSQRWTTESFLKPIPPLSPQWLNECDDGSTEYRLAASLASVRGTYGNKDGKKRYLTLRQQMEPVSTWKAEHGLRARWDWDAIHDVAWTAGYLPDVMNALFSRRLMLAVQAGVGSYPDTGRLWAQLDDITAFIEGRVDDQRIADLLWATVLLDWSRVTPDHFPAVKRTERHSLGALYPLLKLCFSAAVPDHGSDSPQATIPIVARIHRQAAAGVAPDACVEALRRLRGSGLAPALPPFSVGRAETQRTAAALLFPIGERDRQRLASTVLRTAHDDASPSNTLLQHGTAP